jgi:GT2 family glycosyltransferase
MEEVAICVVVDSDLFISKYSIERMLSKTKVKHRLYVIDNGSKDNQLIGYFIDLCNKSNGYFKSFDERQKYSVAINELLRIAYQKYVVIFPHNTLVHENWLEDLIYTHTVIPSLGVASIRNGSEATHFMPLIHHCDSKPEDELLNIHITENNSVEGILCFKTALFEKIGYFDQNLHHSGFEQAEFCFRVASLGLNNIYIRKQTCVKVPWNTQKIKSKEGMEELKMNIEWMIKNQMFKK